jgi:methyl-accepting chemotaxis protein
MDETIIPEVIGEPITEVAETVTEPVTDIVEATAEAVTDAVTEVSEMTRIHDRLDKVDADNNAIISSLGTLAQTIDNLNAATANVAETAVETAADVVETAAELPEETVETVIEGDVDPPNVKRRGHMVRRRR